jgi:hypothetical protein
MLLGVKDQEERVLDDLLADLANPNRQWSDP